MRHLSNLGLRVLVVCVVLCLISVFAASAAGRTFSGEAVTVKLVKGNETYDVLVDLRGGQVYTRAETTPRFDNTAQVAWSLNAEDRLITPSPDGERVAYVKGGDGTLRVRDSERELHRVRPSYGRIYALSWSPDGAHVGFIAGRHYGQLTLVRLSDGAAWRPTNERLPGFAWSPDGTRIAYSNHCQLPSTAVCDMRVIDIASSVERVLTSGGSHYLPRWSPDGAQLTFWSNAESERVLRVMTLDEGASPTSLAAIDEMSYLMHTPPLWSPDGERVVFAKVDYYGDVRVYTVQTATQRVRQTALGTLSPQQLAVEWTGTVSQ